MTRGCNKALRRNYSCTWDVTRTIVALRLCNWTLLLPSFFNFFCDVFYVVLCLFIFPSTQFCLTFFIFLRRCNRFRNRENGRGEGHKEKNTNTYCVRTEWGGVPLAWLSVPLYFFILFFSSFGFIYIFLFHCIFHSFFSFLYLLISFYHTFCHCSLSVIFPKLLPSFVLHLVPLSLHQFCLLFVILLVTVMASYNGNDCNHSEFPTFIYSVNVSQYTVGSVWLASLFVFVKTLATEFHTCK